MARKSSRRNPRTRRDRYQPKESFSSQIYRKITKFQRRHPIASTGLFSFISLIFFRIALFDVNFRPIVGFDEFHFWMFIGALIMLVVAIASGVAWWRRNVPDYHIKGTGDMTWRNK